MVIGIGWIVDTGYIILGNWNRMDTGYIIIGKWLVKDKEYSTFRFYRILIDNWYYRIRNSGGLPF